MQTRVTTVIAALTLSGVVVSPVFAKEYKGKGTAEYDILSTEAVAGEDSGKVRMQYRGPIQQEGDTSPIAGNEQTCTGIFTLDEEGAATAGSGYCDAVDADGDVWALHFTVRDGNAEWNMSWGTGKFEGMTGSGTAETLPAPGENKLKFGFDGAWTMK